MCLRNLFGGKTAPGSCSLSSSCCSSITMTVAAAEAAAVVAAAANLLQKTPGAENRAGRFLLLTDGSAMAIM